MEYENGNISLNNNSSFSLHRAGVLVLKCVVGCFMFVYPPMTQGWDSLYIAHTALEWCTLTEYHSWSLCLIHKVPWGTFNGWVKSLYITIIIITHIRMCLAQIHMHIRSIVPMQLKLPKLRRVLGFLHYGCDRHG